MAFGAATVKDFGGAAGDILGGYATSAADSIKAAGLRNEAVDYGLAANLAGQNEKFTEQSAAVQEAALQRDFEKKSGATATEIAGAGFENSGSAEDIMRGNAQQGAIAQQLAGQQGLITEAGYTEQQQAYTNMQNAANAAANAEDSAGKSAITTGWITGAISGLAGIATLRT